MRTLISIVLLASCGQNSMMLAKVNGESITFGNFKDRLREINFDQTLVAPADAMSLKKYVLNEMIEEKIITQQAELLHIMVTDAEIEDFTQKNFSSEDLQSLYQKLEKEKTSKEEWKKGLGKKILAEKIFEKVTENTPVSSENEINDFYQKNSASFLQKEQVHVLQISTNNKETAKQLQQKILNGEDFLAVSSISSPESTTEPRGDLGFLQRGVLPEAVETKVFSMKPGSISPIIESLPNYYIVKVVDKKPARQIPLEEARQQIQNMLLANSKDKAYTSWLQERMIQAKIKRNDELLQENFSL